MKTGNVCFNKLIWNVYQQNNLEISLYPDSSCIVIHHCFLHSACFCLLRFTARHKMSFLSLSLALVGETTPASSDSDATTSRHLRAHNPHESSRSVPLSPALKFYTFESYVHAYRTHESPNAYIQTYGMYK